MNKDLRRWIDQYGSHDMCEVKEPSKILAELKSSLLGHDVYLYGAGAVGNTFVRLFRYLGIEVKAAFDKDYLNRKIEGIETFSPDYMKAIMKKEDDVLIISSNWRNYDVISDYIDHVLGEMGSIEKYNGSLMHAPLQRAICADKNLRGERIEYHECPSCFMERNYCDLLKNNLLACKKGLNINRGMSKLPLIGVILGNHCSLRCEHCVESIPFNRFSRSFEDKNLIIDSISRMAKSIEFVSVIDFVGGEPFLHPDLPEIIEEVIKIPNVGLVNVFTNGTVTPSEKLTQALKNDFVVVNISDYSNQLSEEIIERINKTELVLKTEKIPYVRVKNMTWFDMSSYEKNSDTEEELTKRFHDCRINSCHRLYRGMLFRCLHLYAGYVSGHLSLDETVVNIFDGSSEELAIKLDEFWNRPYSSACQYCELPYISRLVPSGKQVES